MNGIMSTTSSQPWRPIEVLADRIAIGRASRVAPSTTHAPSWIVFHITCASCGFAITRNGAVRSIAVPVRMLVSRTIQSGAAMSAASRTTARAAPSVL